MRVHQLLTLAALIGAFFTPTNAGAVVGGRRLTGANSECGKARVRKSWVAMSQDEKDLYKEAVTSAMKSGEFFEFTKVHMESMSERQAHSTCAFLLWHKRYLLAYENMLRSQGAKYACVTIPFWDAMKDYGAQADGSCSNIWDCSPIVRELGGRRVSNGAVTRIFNGARVRGVCYSSFAGDAYCDDNGQCGCVPRGDLTNQLPAGCGYSSIFNHISYSLSFADFTKKIQDNAHNELHSAVSGVMGTFASPSDPLFWSWHANIDMMLYLYHQCHVPGTMTDADIRQSIYGFDRGGGCKYDASAPDANIDGKLVQQDGRGSASQNPKIGKYFEDLSENIADYISYRGLGENSYHYQVPEAFVSQLLQSEQYCRIYWKEWKDDKKVPIDTTLPSQAPGGDDVETGTVAPPTNKPKTPRPSKSLPVNGSAAGGIDVGDEDSVDTPIPTRATNGTKKGKKYVDEYDPTAVKPCGIQVLSDNDFDKEKGYWKWFCESQKKLETVYPGNITEIAKQMEYVDCCAFNTQFGVAVFSDEFRANFNINITVPNCGKKAEEVKEGKKEIVLEAKSFHPEEVTVKPGVTPYPAVDPEVAFQEYQKAANQQSADATSSAATACTSLMTMGLALVAYYWN